MINLLPDETKRNIRAARTNVILLRYNMLTLATIAMLAGVCTFYYFVMHNTQSTAVTTSQDNNALAASYNSVRQQANEYRSNLTIAKQILANGSNYTTAIFAITELLPSGVVLDNIALGAANFGQQMTFSAHAKSFDKATELKQKFQNSSMFSNVYLQSVTDASGTSASSPYPIAVTLSAKLNGAAK